MVAALGSGSSSTCDRARSSVGDEIGRPGHPHPVRRGGVASLGPPRPRPGPGRDRARGRSSPQTTPIRMRFRWLSGYRSAARNVPGASSRGSITPVSAPHCSASSSMSVTSQRRGGNGQHAGGAPVDQQRRAVERDRRGTAHRERHDERAPASRSRSRRSRRRPGRRSRRRVGPRRHRAPAVASRPPAHRRPPADAPRAPRRDAPTVVRADPPVERPVVPDDGEPRRARRRRRGPRRRARRRSRSRHASRMPRSSGFACRSMSAGTISAGVRPS